MGSHSSIFFYHAKEQSEIRSCQGSQIKIVSESSSMARVGGWPWVLQMLLIWNFPVNQVGPGARLLQHEVYPWPRSLDLQQ